MAKYAYRDEQRKDEIYSVQAIEEDRDRSFYCPNPNCNAQLYICAIDGSKAAYFRAARSEYPHILNCPYGKNSIAFDKDKFDESKFVFDDAMENLFKSANSSQAAKNTSKHGEGVQQDHPPRTIREIYAMCKSLPVRAKYGDKEIGEMILDDRSEYRYPKGCFGYKIIEATVKRRFYDNEKKEIYLAAPMDSKKYTFILKFIDNDTYRVIRNEIFNNRDKIIVVAGRWEASDKHNFFITKVCKRKQVAIIKE